MCLGAPMSVGGEMVYAEVVADRRAIRVLPLPGGSFRRYGRGLSRAQMVASSCRAPFGADMGGPHRGCGWLRSLLFGGPAPEIP